MRPTPIFPKEHTSIHARADPEFEIAIVGAGIAGIATAYYLAVAHKKTSIVLIDSRPPMSFTSAQSGDNYRNWWPHRTMTDFTNNSIDELERLSRESDDVFNMTRGGYCLATRQSDVDTILAAIPGNIDVDLVRGRSITERFPALTDEMQSVIHIRRGGDISGQQLGQYLLGQFRAVGGKRLQAEVLAIDKRDRFELTTNVAGTATRVRAATLVNAAGPFLNRIATMLGVELPVKNVYQQKIAFEDRLAAIPRDMPFSIDLDPKELDWSNEERAMLAEDPDLAWLSGILPGGTHCRPEGGPNGKWVKLGWAYNQAPAASIQEDLANDPAIDPAFPEIVLRGAAAFLPSLRPYVSAPPARFSHYGGYYTMTDENWPLIGPLNDTGAFVVGALSGFGSMAACAAGKLCAAWITGQPLPDYARDLSLSRFDDTALMAELRASANKGLL